MPTDVIAEKAVLSAIYNGGSEVFFDVCDVIQNSNTFSIRHNEYLYLCLKHAIEGDNTKRPDIATIFTSAQEQGIPLSQECQEHINQVIYFDTDSSNARQYAGKIRKLKVGSLLEAQLQAAQGDIGQITGREAISEILGLAENRIFDFSQLINDIDSEPRDLSGGLLDLIKERIENPVEQVGVSTGFPRFDSAIGGGLRPSSLSVIAARTKGFKSGLALNMANHISSLNIPILYVDTELTTEEQQFRVSACISEVDINQIETGKVKNDTVNLDKLRSSIKAKLLDLKNIYHQNVVGTSFEDQISMMRRWLFKTPGIQLNGKANPCVIIFDYIKLMDSSGMGDMAEYQKIGFMASTLHNFSVKYNIPILTFIQLNRDGIVREDSSAISQSDRVAWFCSNVSIFKPKSNEEIMAENELGIIDAGNFKLMTLHCRHGKGIRHGDYINVEVTGNFFKASERNMHTENVENAKSESSYVDEGIVGSDGKTNIEF